MSKWIDVEQAAALVDMEVATFRRIVKSSNNPPPFVRPSERSMLFDADSLREWQDAWTVGGGKQAAT
jgi:hypothetical protein